MRDKLKTDQDLPRMIGGLFPLETPLNLSAHISIIQKWTQSAASVFFFHNARSALHFVLREVAPGRIWLPAYLCPEIKPATSGATSNVSYFPLTKTLQPDIEFLSMHLTPNDAVLTINYFGRGPSRNWLNFIDNQHDILWIEDCAQVIDIGTTHHSDIQIYSPRKIFGVPDGGVLVDTAGRLEAPSLSSPPTNGFMVPYEMRKDDLNDENNAEWYRAFRKTEDQMCVTSARMSEVSRNSLKNIEIDPITRKRRRNYRYLYDNLSNIALFPNSRPEWAPLCFPVIVENADLLGEHLAQNRVFAPRYWRALTSPVTDFPWEHTLSKKLLGLPCDQRYGKMDMARIVNLIESFNY